MGKQRLAISTDPGNLIASVETPSRTRGLAPNIDLEKVLPTPTEPNFTPTKDPDVVIGKYGAPITRQEFELANKNGYSWKDFPAYADYVGGWARPNPKPILPDAPYFRVYGGTENINSGQLQLLAMKNDPQINTLLQRNIAKKGEVPMYSAQDADVIRALIQHERNQAISSHL